MQIKNKLGKLRYLAYALHATAFIACFAVTASQEHIPEEMTYIYNVLGGASVGIDAMAFYIDKLQRTYEEQKASSDRINENLTQLSETMSTVSIKIPEFNRNEPIDEPTHETEDTDRSVVKAEVMINRRTGEILEYVKGLTPRAKQ